LEGVNKRMSEKKFHVAVVGATGAVGQQMLKTLEERNFPIGQISLLASARSAGQEITFKGETVVIKEATPEAFEGVDIALFSAGGSISKELAPEAVKRGALVIDNTNAYRMDHEVPLVVPEVNSEDIFLNKGIIANPNCSTIQMVVALKPLKDRFGLKKIIVSTYQAVSGAGNLAQKELLRQTKAIVDSEDFTPEILPVSSLEKKHQIAFNAIPQIDVFQDNGFTLEEMKMVRETKKIMHDDSLQVVATCVRIPVLTGHSESIYIELESEASVDEVRQLFEAAPGIIVEDTPGEQHYPLATTAAGRPEVFVGRIRKDLDNPKGIHLWVVSDNLLKGAAWNSVQIAETYIEQLKS
jgi:aspartate-semialdehyde dehydrogenase